MGERAGKRKTAIIIGGIKKSRWYFSKEKKDIIKNSVILGGILFAGFIFCFIIKNFYETNNLIPAVMVMCVFLVSVFTEGYVYDIISSILSTLIVNFAFQFPYFKLDFLIPENITTACLMLIIAFITSGLTSELKYQDLIRKEGELEKMRANLLRAVSHDLRTPLTTIYGASSALIEGADEFTDEQKLEMLEGIQSDSLWLNNMVENLLSVTRLEGEVELIKTPIVLDELVDSVLLKFAKRYKNQHVNVDIPEEIVIIPMDAMLIEQVILNILENAVVHAKGMKHLELKVFIQGENAVFEIKDDGCGITAEKLGHLFDGHLFMRGQSSDSARNGAGIGLTVCSSIIKAHGGSLSVFNSARGVVFTFMLKREETTQ